MSEVKYTEKDLRLDPGGGYYMFEDGHDVFVVGMTKRQRKHMVAKHGKIIWHHVIKMAPDKLRKAVWEKRLFKHRMVAE